MGIPDERATSHAGVHGDFEVWWTSGMWTSGTWIGKGWYWSNQGGYGGPFATSQAAFGNCNDLIDYDIDHEDDESHPTTPEER